MRLLPGGESRHMVSPSVITSCLISFEDIVGNAFLSKFSQDIFGDKVCKVAPDGFWVYVRTQALEVAVGDARTARMQELECCFLTWVDRDAFVLTVKFQYILFFRRVDWRCRRFDLAIDRNAKAARCFFKV